MPSPVDEYLDAIRSQDWERLRAVLAPDLVRHGPYGDHFDDRETYLAFLRETFTTLGDYRLDVRGAFGTESRTCVELAETATVDGRRLHTEEAVVFSVDGDHITEVRVFLQRSTQLTSEA